MRVLPRRCAALVAAWCLGVVVQSSLAQQPTPPPTPAETPVDNAAEIATTGDIVVSSVVKVAGRIDPGKASTDAESKAAPKVVDRRIEWCVGGQTFSSLAKLQIGLGRIAMDMRAMRDDPETGGKMLARLRIEPDPATHWGELVGLWDAAMAAGWRDVAFAAVDTPWLMAMSTYPSEVVRDRLVVPEAIYSEPDESPPDARLTFDVLRDGSVMLGDRTLFRWQAGHAEDLAPLRQELLAVRSRMNKAGLVVQRRGHEQLVIDEPVLVRADQWAEWRDVRQLFAELVAPDVGYWKLEFAVGEPAPKPHAVPQDRDR